jgi:hypothetical protein
MKTLGIVGGTAPDSTIEYYRLIVASYRDRVRDGSYPSLLINSIDLKKMLDLIPAAPRLPVCLTGSRGRADDRLQITASRRRRSISSAA